jgi:hypothetical protein
MQFNVIFTRAIFLDLSCTWVQIIELKAKQQTKQTQSQRKTTTNNKTYEIKS